MKETVEPMMREGKHTGYMVNITSPQLSRRIMAEYLGEKGVGLQFEKFVGESCVATKIMISREAAEALAVILCKLVAEVKGGAK